MNNIDYKIYCTYHDKKLIDEYQLKETNNFKLFYTKDNLDGYSLNHLQLYLNEYVTMYYIWKNNIKSDIVGFCHYRRVFDNINFERINNDETQAYEIFLTPAHNVFHDFNYVGLGYFFDSILDYINKNYYDYYFNFLEIIFNPNERFKRKLVRESFICKWEIFNQLMKFINNYLEYLFNESLEKITLNEIDKISNDFNSLQWNHRLLFIQYYKIDNIDGFFGYPRNIAFLIEYLIEIFFLLFYENKYFVDN